MPLSISQSLLTPLSAVNAPLIANSAAESSLLGPSGLITFPSGSFGEGSTIVAMLWGKFSNRASTPGTITFKAMLGDALLWSSGALSIPATVHTGIPFFLDLRLIFRAGGAQAKVLPIGKLEAALSATTDFFLPSANPVESATFDLGVDRDLDFTAKFSAADPGNSIQLLGYVPLV